MGELSPIAYMRHTHSLKSVVRHRSYQAPLSHPFSSFSPARSFPPPQNTLSRAPPPPPLRRHTSQRHCFGLSRRQGLIQMSRKRRNQKKSGRKSGDLDTPRAKGSKNINIYKVRMWGSYLPLPADVRGGGAANQYAANHPMVW